MSGLSEFLLARIDEDVAIAMDMRHQAMVGRSLLVLLGGGTGIRRLTDPDHIQDQCEARRRIVEMHKPWGFEYGGGEGCERCSSPDDYAVSPLPLSERFPCATLRLLALPYAEHPDFQDEWRA